MSNTSTPGGWMTQLFDWFWEPPHFGDRRIQVCCVVLFCMEMIVVVYLAPSGKPEIDGRVIDWSFAALLGVVGIYHTARSVDELLGRRSSTAVAHRPSELSRYSRRKKHARGARRRCATG